MFCPGKDIFDGFTKNIHNANCLQAAKRQIVFIRIDLFLRKLPTNGAQNRVNSNNGALIFHLAISGIRLFHAVNYRAAALITSRLIAGLLAAFSCQLFCIFMYIIISFIVVCLDHDWYMNESQLRQLEFNKLLESLVLNK